MAGRPLILAIETATGCGSVSLTRGGCEDGRLLAEATARPEITHSRRLLGSVAWIMEAAGVEWSDLDGVAVSLGPGSFTGLRIGLAAAKGIVCAAGVPLLGVETLAALALSCPYIDRPLWCLLDARKQEVYAARFQPDCDGRPEQVGDVAAVRPEQLAERIREPVILAGPGVAEYQAVFSGIAEVQLVPGPLSSPRAARIGFLGAERLLCRETLDPALAVPLYVRASEAEINLKKHGNSEPQMNTDNHR
jgi:tRNA threonylcarbamoyladenosine biosynthesis protein TsaB